MNESLAKREWVRPVLLKLDNFDETATGVVAALFEANSGYIYHHAGNFGSITHTHSSYFPITT